MKKKRTLYEQTLAGHLVRLGVEGKEAKQAAALVVKTLKKQGAGFQLGHAKKMAEWLVAQKEKVDEGILAAQEDGSVYDKESDTVYTAED